MISSLVLYGSSRLYSGPAYSVNNVAESLVAGLSDTLASADADLISAEKALADTETMVDVAIVISAGKALTDTATMTEARAMSVVMVALDSTAMSDSAVAISSNKGVTDFIRMKEWLSIVLTQASKWTQQSTTGFRPSVPHIYGNVLYGPNYYSSNPTVIWIKPGNNGNVWTNNDGENNQEV